MNKIVCTNQTQLNEIPLDFAGEIEIRFGTPFRPANLRKNYPRARVKACGSSTVMACGSSTVTACDSSTVIAYDCSRVKACGSSTVTACDSSTVIARDSSTVIACDSSRVTACGSSTVIARDSSTVIACDSSRVKACGSSTVIARDSSRVTARDSSTVIACDSSRVTAYDCSSVEAYNVSSIEAHDGASVMANGFTQVIKMSNRAETEMHDMARYIEPNADINTFCLCHGVKRDGEESIWYKAVHRDEAIYTADYDQDFTYTVGEEASVEDLNTDREQACGTGIHIATLRWALDYGQDWDDLAILEVRAKTADIVLPYNSTGKVRVDRVKVIREVPPEEWDDLRGACLA